MTPLQAKPSLLAAKALLDSAQLPTSDLTEQHCEHFFYCGPVTAPTGLVGLELFDDVALLRSLVVNPDARASGLGTALVQHAEGEARAHGVRIVYLLTTTAEEFFGRRGYAKVSRDAAPAAIKTTREFTGICPASAAFMSKLL